MPVWEQEPPAIDGEHRDRARQRAVARAALDWWARTGTVIMYREHSIGLTYQSRAGHTFYSQPGTPVEGGDYAQEKPLPSDNAIPAGYVGEPTVDVGVHLASVVYANDQEATLMQAPLSATMAV